MDNSASGLNTQCDISSSGTVRNEAAKEKDSDPCPLYEDLDKLGIILYYSRLLGAYNVNELNLFSTLAALHIIQ